MAQTENLGRFMYNERRIMSLDIVLFMTIILSFFSYTKLFDEKFLFKFLCWSILGVVSAFGAYSHFRIRITKDYSKVAYSKVVFVIFFLLGGVYGGHVYSTFARTYLLVITFIVQDYLIRNDGWYEKFIKLMLTCSLIYIITAVIQVFSTPIIASISQLILPGDYMDYYNLLISNHYYIGIATQASYQVHYILPLSAVSISVYLFGNNARYKRIAIVMFCFSFLAMVLSQKRMPLVALAICVAMSLMLPSGSRKSLNRKLFLIVVLVIMAVAVFVSRVGSRLFARFGGKIVTENVRMEMWSTALGLLDFKNLFLGTGVGRISDKIGLSAHNSFVQVLVENGIIGLICYLIFTIVPIVYTIKLIRRIRKNYILMHDFSKVLILLMSSLIVQIFCLIHSFTESVFSNDVMFFPLQIFVAMSYSIGRRTRYIEIQD